MSILAANPCHPKAPTIFTLDSVDDFSWIKQPFDGDIAVMVVGGATAFWVFRASYTGEVDSISAVAGGCQGAWVLAGPEIDVQLFGAVLDGVTDDSEAFAEAFAAFPSEGGVLVVTGPAGIGADGILLDTLSGVTILGRGPNAGFVSLAVTVLDIPLTATPGTVLAMKDCSRCRIEGLRFDGASFQNKGIGMEGCSDCVISDNEFFAFNSIAGARAAVMSFGGTRNTYSRNYIHDTQGQCPAFYLGNTNPGEIETEALITANHIKDIGFDGVVGCMIGSTISSNIIDTVGASCIALGSAPSPGIFSRTVITGNICRRGNFHGIQSDASASAADYTEFIVVTNNLVEECVNTGIYVVRTQDWIVSNNIVRDNGNVAGGYGIYVDNARRIIISGNNCKDTRAGAARWQRFGIDVTALDGDVSNILISGNLCQNNQDSGILVINSAGKTISNIALSGNMSVENGQFGIWVASVAPGDISGVTFTSNAATGNVSANISNNVADAQLCDPGIGYTSQDIVGNLMESLHPQGLMATGASSHLHSTNTYFNGNALQQIGAWAILNTGQARFLNVTIDLIGEYADNAAAITAGAGVGQLYRTGDLVKIVH